MTTLTNPLPLAATASIIASAWASGAGAAISFFTITPILRSSAPREVLLQQWHLAYDLGKSVMPPAAGAIAASYLGVAWAVANSHQHHQGSSGSEWRGFAAAAALMVGIVPFTLLFVMRTIRELEALMIVGGDGANGKSTDATRHGESEEDREQALLEEARSLLRRWSRLNLVRAMLPLVGTGFAVWNLSKVLSA
ncbi:hypothetical protein E8E14_013551 [Neopestalotiopsis sp. 37M]|nr:hypothetical protein E8E14_013551 [Neopestalotiopsis sp. 37M]